MLRGLDRRIAQETDLPGAPRRRAARVRRARRRPLPRELRPPQGHVHGPPAAASTATHSNLVEPQRDVMRSQRWFTSVVGAARSSALWRTCQSGRSSAARERGFDLGAVERREREHGAAADRGLVAHSRRAPRRARPGRRARRARRPRLRGRAGRRARSRSATSAATTCRGRVAPFAERERGGFGDPRVVVVEQLTSGADAAPRPERGRGLGGARARTVASAVARRPASQARLRLDRAPVPRARARRARRLATPGVGIAGDEAARRGVRRRRSGDSRRAPRAAAARSRASSSGRDRRRTQPTVRHTA